jgi:hypothetical protein
LLKKLEGYGIGGKLLKWISEYLANRTIKVAMNGELSENRSINAGVPQGSILGPLLWLIWINDLPDTLSHCEDATFADDTTLHSITQHTKDRKNNIKKIEKDLERLDEWSKEWKITFEPDKGHTTTISCKKDAKEIEKITLIKFGENHLKAEEKFEMLGVIFDDGLTFAKHIRQICAETTPRLCMLRRLCRIMEKDKCVMMYKAYIRSRLEYASNVWMGADTSHLKKLDKIQERALKIMQITKSERKKYKIHPLEERREINALTTLYKMHLKSCPTLLKKLLPSPLITNPPGRRTRRTEEVKGNKHSLDIKSFCNLDGIKRSQGNRLFNTDKFERTFIFLTTEKWNRLPDNIIGQIDEDGSITLDKTATMAFKNRVTKYYQEQKP